MSECVKTSRREFVAVSGALVAAGAAGTAFAGDVPKAGPRIVQVEHPGATTSETKIDVAIVTRLLHEALRTYSGTPTAADALRRTVRPDQKVMIKVNTLGSPYASVNPETAWALAELLIQIGVPKANIRIEDQYNSRMVKGRYRMSRKPGEVWVTRHTGRDPAIQVYEDGKRRVRYHYCETVVWADVVINVCVPKDHDLTGVTGALKNMAMGVVYPTKEAAADKSNPGWYTVVPKFHANNCDPAIPKLYSRPMIRSKVKLIVVDALRVLYHGGPQDSPRHRLRHNQIWVAEDPVAVDRTIHGLVNRIRKEKGLKPVEQDLFRGRPRLPHYLDTAARMGLGEGDPAKIRVEKKTLS